MSDIIISCAGDNELAENINNYLIDKNDSINDNTHVSFHEDEVRIIPEKPRLFRDNIRNILKDFIASNPRFADRYSIMEFENVFIIAIPKSLDKMIINCEMCEYIATSEDDLNIHKRTPGFIFI
jgi:hypothetical protein